MPDALPCKTPPYISILMHFFPLDLFQPILQNYSDIICTFHKILGSGLLGYLLLFLLVTFNLFFYESEDEEEPLPSLSPQPHTLFSSFIFCTSVDLPNFFYKNLSCPEQFFKLFWESPKSLTPLLFIRRGCNSTRRVRFLSSFREYSSLYF